MNESLVGEACSLESLVGRLADDFLRRQEAGERPDVEEYAARHPHAADLLRKVLASLRLLDVSLSGGAAPGDGPATGALGDFRILREVGRGGMGVVYEAEQVSLGRRVALKVLPFAATMDPRHLQRFHNEARAAASLHHPNIVPVYAVGEERAVHYYAMQFIEGQTLAAMIADLRRRGGQAALSEARPTTTDAPAAPPAPASATAERAAASTERAPRGRADFRRAAELGVQAAAALEYAHQLGIVHRDVKPANLLVDGRGNLWVTDFGLAQVRSDTRLTLTGDLVGTLRYMSPEQALAKRAVIDHRADVYSLGATLYELLTLEPVFAGDDREELLRQIAFEEPRPPTRHDRTVPTELETIVLKAIAKSPAERYATAQELADDLRYWLEDRPIRARRPTLVQRARKWSRRHRPIAAGMAIVLLAALVAAGALGFWQQRRLAATDRGVTAALTQAETLLAEGDKQTDQPERWQATVRLAQAALEKAEELLAAGAATERLAARVRQVREAVDAAVADSGLLVEVDRIRLEQGAVNVKEGRFDEARAAPLYAEVLRSYGVEMAAPEAAAARVQDSRLREALLAALAEWERVTPDKGERQRVARVIDLVLPTDSLPARLRAATRRRDCTEVVKLAQELSIQDLPPTTIVKTALDLEAIEEWTAAEQLLRAGWQRKPGDFWLNQALGSLLLNRKPRRAEDAARYFTAALALRSDSPGAHYNLGRALHEKGDVDGAIAEYKAALHLQPDYATAHLNLGSALHEKGDVDGAIAENEEALRIKPDEALAHYNIGNALRDKGDMEAAIQHYRAAIQLDPNHAGARYNLGTTLGKKGDVDGAIAEYKQALRIEPDHALAHNNLGIALYQKGDVEGAIGEYKAALRLQPDHPGTHVNLGAALTAKGRVDEAIAEFREAIRLKSDFPQAHCNLGNALDRKGDVDGAIAEYKGALRIKPNYALAHNNLGNALRRKGRLDEAITEFREAIRLNNDFPQARNNLGIALADMGQLEGAIAEYKAALRIKPDYAEAHCNLGLALQQQGEFRQALDELRRGHQLGSRSPHWPHPSGQWVRRCERLIELEGKLPDFLTGKAMPASADERFEMAAICYHKGLNAAAARFCQEAFAADPKTADDPRTGHCYDAACVAALAGCGQGKDAAVLGDQERARLRRQALAWLRADLTAWQFVLEKEPDKARVLVRQKMEHWQQEGDLAGVRGREALAKLPKGERADWQKLWADVEETLAKIRQENRQTDKPAK